MRVVNKLLCVRAHLLRAGVVLLFSLHPLTSFAQGDWCSCPGGAVLQPGLVNYKENSDREIITRIEVKKGDPEHSCEAAWIGFSEIDINGTPYRFHLHRKKLKTIRESGCGDSPNRFVNRSKTYRFVLDADSESIPEMDPIADKVNQPPDSRPGEKSNANIWDSILTGGVAEPLKRPKTAGQNNAAPEFVRRAWVLARRDVKGHYVGLARSIDQREMIQTLSRTNAIRAGELGQIEASNDHTAIVRFYAGSRIEKFTRQKNALRRWYDNIGGPYMETKDDLYSPLRTCILEVSLDDIIEVNDYLDQQNTDQT